MKFLFLILTTFIYFFINAQPTINLSGTKWSLIKITNLTTNQSKSADAICGTTLHFDNKEQYSGFTGWNNYSGKYTITGENRLVMYNAVQTLMAGPSNCEFGETICGQFQNIKTFLIKADTLMLFTSDSNKITYKKIK